MKEKKEQLIILGLLLVITTSLISYGEDEIEIKTFSLEPFLVKKVMGDKIINNGERWEIESKDKTKNTIIAKTGSFSLNESPEVLRSHYIEVEKGAQMNGGGTGAAINLYGSTGMYTHGTADGFDYSVGSAGADFPPTGRQCRDGCKAAFGGGMLIIQGDIVKINGEIECDGGIKYRCYDCFYREYGASGSGGCIFIMAKHLEIGPDAYIHANGSPDPVDPLMPRGGGGRIKIFYQEGTISESAVIEARGSGDLEKYMGTVHIEQLKFVPDVFTTGPDINGDKETNYKDLFLMTPKWQEKGEGN